MEELVKDRYELPAFSTPDRLARKVRYADNSALFAEVDEGLTDAERARIDELLRAGSRGRSDLGVLKVGPKSATKKNLDEMQERLISV